MAISVLAIGMAGALMYVPGQAVAEVPGSGPALLDGVAAVELATKTGEPVVATALTDEHTLVTADPQTGLLSADLSAGVARVRDGNGGWREPSSNLVMAPDGSWSPEAATVPLVISGGGTGEFVVLGEGEKSVAFVWPTALPGPSVTGNLATFGDVAPGVDLVVRAAVDGAESFLVVKDAQAGQSPLVRSMPIQVVGKGLAAVAEDGGTVAYVDAGGEARFWVPPAYAWDSAGQGQEASLAELLDPAEGSRVEALPAEVAGVASRVGFDASASAWDLLDDPATVFPVIIDPSATGTQSYAVRVTQDFNKYNSDIGSEGKLGYNGWTSPFYKSRMYYQFRWPLWNGSPMPAPRIVSASFMYTQTHSPQHSCTDNDFGPSVKVQFHNTISSDTTWADQPGVHSGSGSVSNDYAVGHEDVCDKTYNQTWNVSSMVLAERSAYSTRTTVTVGLRSNDEADKNGWREYKHSSGSSPKLTIVYEAEPPAPVGLTVTPLISGAGLVTAASGVTLSTTVSNLLKRCPDSMQQGCLAARFTLTNTAVPAETYTYTSGAVGYNATATYTVPQGTLKDSSSYTVAVQTLNRATGSYSPAVNYTLVADFPPGATEVAWDATPRLGQLKAVATNADPLASFGWSLTYTDGNGVQQTSTGTWSRPSGAAGTTATFPVGAPTGYEGIVSLKVWAIDTRGSAGPWTGEITALLR